MQKNKGETVLNVNNTLLKRDMLAGLTLFVMLIPQGMAYAMLAGLPPVMGLYASTIPLFIYALLGSSKHLSIGPTAITSLLVFSGVSAFADPGTSLYVSIVLLLALLVGAVQLCLGVFKLGFIVKFIPNSVMNGYISAAAIVIGVSQLKHIVGVDIGNYLQVHFIIIELFNRFSDINWLSVILGLISIVVLTLLKHYHTQFPAALFLVVFASLMVFFFQLEDKGVHIVGEVPKGLPNFSVPAISFETVQMLIPISIIIALLGFMESLSIGKAVAQKEGYKIDPNKELRALGVANVASSCFSAFPVNGSFSRTAVNHQAGGATRLTSVITGLFVIIALLFFTSFFYYLPNAALAAIIIVAVYKLIDLKEVKHLFHVKPFEGWIWLTTFGTTLFIGIQWGILVGALFTLLLLIKRSAKPNIVELGYIKKSNTFRDIQRFPEAQTSDELLIIRIDSSLHFANSSFLDETIRSLLYEKPKVKWLILDMSGVNDIDTAAMAVLAELMDYYQKEKNMTVLFANMKGTVRDTIDREGWGQQYKEQLHYLSIEQVLKERNIPYSFVRTRKEKEEWVNDFQI
ncbi:SulP family inorganic anion transporter [Halalkalibacter urbisdiaboli]|uniref:SulP family inorganic anion transporter n=1 Tax=Halalkalibacter urbisdiaboli TaxID=1960589 RepID=UPI000B4386B6|nr:sulfate permease [Halalkalibacter urbisdiaboli]